MIALSLVFGCLTGDKMATPDTSPAADTASTADTGDTDPCHGSTDPCWQYTQSATVSPGTSYQGSMELAITSPDGTQTCLYDWTASADYTTARADCPDCSFAFDLQLANGLQMAGDCAHAALGATGHLTVGFAPTFSATVDGTDYTWTDVAVTYETDKARWYPFAPATYSGGQFSAVNRFPAAYSY